MRSFFVHDGSDEADRALAAWVRMTPDQAGPIVATHRLSAEIGFLVRLAAIGGVVMLGFFLAVAFVAAFLAGAETVLFLAALVAVLTLVVLVVAGLFVALIAVGAARVSVSVARHALILKVGSRLRVIPYATMDPGRMRWITSPWGGRHFATLGHRRAFVGGDGLLICGTDEDERGLGFVLEAVFDPFVTAKPVSTPYVWWYLGPRDPRAFLSDMERAMVADGYPVQGLAEWVSAHRMTIPCRRTGQGFGHRLIHEGVSWPPRAPGVRG